MLLPKSRAERGGFLVQEVTLYDGPAMPGSALWWNGRQMVVSADHFNNMPRMDWSSCSLVLLMSLHHKKKGQSTVLSQNHHSSHPHLYLELDEVTFTLSSHNAAKKLTVLFFLVYFIFFTLAVPEIKLTILHMQGMYSTTIPPRSWYVGVFYISKRKQPGRVRETSKFWILTNIYFSALITV